MKYVLFLAALGLTACGSGSADKSTVAAAPDTAATPSPSSDPRIDQIRALRSQLLTLQKSFAETTKQLTPLEEQAAKARNNEMLQKDNDFSERKQEFSKLVSSSEDIAGTINQLDSSKSQDAAQAQLVGESLARSKALLVSANDLVAQNKKWVAFFERTAAFRNSHNKN